MKTTTLAIVFSVLVISAMCQDSKGKGVAQSDQSQMQGKGVGADQNQMQGKGVGADAQQNQGKGAAVAQEMPKGKVGYARVRSHRRARRARRNQ